ncbi:DUF6801 domain-containing protein [Streptomyces sp. NPDC088785]|uniref:DUF6801 domain-containing protein n=1 Tax=Streptomyces sp. NPDC088785 TaxID=3365897 RepID=UPI0037F780D7
MTAPSRRSGRPGGARAVRLARVVPIASVALAAGLLSGPGSHADEGSASVEIAYDCAVPPPAAEKQTDGAAQTQGDGGTSATAGTPGPPTTVRATVTISTELPRSARPGTPIDPGAVTVEAALPYAGLAPLLPGDVSGITSEATLGVQVQQGKSSADASWASLAASASTPPADGTLRLGHTGGAPTITVSEAGDVEVFAGELGLKISPLASGSENGTAAPSFAVTCTPASKEAAGRRIAGVSVPETEKPGASSPGASDDPSDTARDGIAVEPEDGSDSPAGASTCAAEMPSGEMDTSQIPEPLPGSVLAPPYINDGTRACAYAVGMTTIRKPNGSVIINDPAKDPGLMNIKASAVSQFATEGPFYFRIDSLGELTLPDADSTILNFGFVPVTAKVAFDNGQITISTGTKGSFPDQQNFAVATFFQSLRVHDVKVNGTPLDVGSQCRTSKKYRVTLRGDFTSPTDAYTNVLTGGILKGKVDIPSFSGCEANGENLDRLLTASLSGPGNSIVMNQAMTCLPDLPEPNQCPPIIPPLPGAKPE